MNKTFTWWFNPPLVHDLRYLEQAYLIPNDYNRRSRIERFWIHYVVSGSFLLIVCLRLALWPVEKLIQLYHDYELARIIMKGMGLLVGAGLLLTYIYYPELLTAATEMVRAWFRPLWVRS